MNDLGLDSLDVVEIVMAFEDEFGMFSCMHALIRVITGVCFQV